MLTCRRRSGTQAIQTLLHCRSASRHRTCRQRCRLGSSCWKLDDGVAPASPFDHSNFQTCCASTPKRHYMICSARSPADLDRRPSPPSRTKRHPQASAGGKPASHSHSHTAAARANALSIMKRVRGKLWCKLNEQLEAPRLMVTLLPREIYVISWPRE